MVETQLDEALKNRHSVREFEKTTIPKDHISLILEASNSAPSAGNLQAYRIFVTTGKEEKDRISQCAFEQELIKKAPLCLVFAADPDVSASEYGSRGKDLYAIQDATIAASFAVLKAVDLGYGAAWVGSFDVKRLSKEINAQNLLPVAIIVLGIPGEKPQITSRKKIEEIATFLG